MSNAIDYRTRLLTDVRPAVGASVVYMINTTDVHIGYSADRVKTTSKAHAEAVALRYMVMSHLTDVNIRVIEPWTIPARPAVSLLARLMAPRG